MQVQCDFCPKFGLLGSDVHYVKDMENLICNGCMSNMPCDYCPRRGRLGETIKYCVKCGKLFCPYCKWKLPTRAMNAIREKVFGQHTGRERP